MSDILTPLLIQMREVLRDINASLPKFVDPDAVPETEIAEITITFRQLMRIRTILRHGDLVLSPLPALPKPDPFVFAEGEGFVTRPAFTPGDTIDTLRRERDEARVVLERTRQFRRAAEATIERLKAEIARKDAEAEAWCRLMGEALDGLDGIANWGPGSWHYDGPEDEAGGMRNLAEAVAKAVREKYPDAALQPTETPACAMCEGKGLIGGWRVGDGYDSEPCPECTPAHTEPPQEPRHDR